MSSDSPRTAAGRLAPWLKHVDTCGFYTHEPCDCGLRTAILAIEAAASPSASGDALREALEHLCNAVDLLEARDKGSGGTFDVWMEERNLTATRDEARAALAASPAAKPRWDPQEEHCHKCGRHVGLIWTAPDDLWQEVMGGPGGIRCIRCFDEEAEQKGHLLRWVPVDANLPLAASPPLPEGLDADAMFTEFLDWEERAARKGSGLTKDQRTGALMFKRWLQARLQQPDSREGPE